MNASSSDAVIISATDSSVPSNPATGEAQLEAGARRRPKHSAVFWFLLATLVAIGSLGLSPQFISLWTIWTTDPLRSIGMLIAPASIILLLREWRQKGWELRGTWWGMVPLALSFVSILSSRSLILSIGSGEQTINLIPHVLPIYLYASGVVLLIAGVGLWKKAWFPLALLLCLQPVPAFLITSFDLPLQGLSAHIARSFAVLIGFPPTSTELLRLMFTPDFGMFIAPGCDGMRGAVTLGYVALVAGYLKRVSLIRWFLYVTGAVLLGHLFNLIRLCTLVVYYRIAAGHPALENIAKQADYVIGGCLFMVAALLFMWVVLRKGYQEHERDSLPTSAINVEGRPEKLFTWKTAAFTGLAVIAAVPGVHAIILNRDSLAATERGSDLSARELDDRVPRELGGYRLIRTWQEQEGSSTVMENAAYVRGASEEITVGIWLHPTGHSVHESWMTHGASPLMRADRSFVTADGKTVSFDSAFYMDGTTDSFAGNTYCSPAYCAAALESESGIHLSFAKSADFTTRGARLVPIYFRVEKVHTSGPQDIACKELLNESQSFLAGVKFSEFSKRFQ